MFDIKHPLYKYDIRVTDCKWYLLQFHNWQYIEEVHTREKFGEKYNYWYTSYRVCSVCNLVQEYQHAFSGGFYWTDVGHDEGRIIIKNIGGILRWKK